VSALPRACPRCDGSGEIEFDADSAAHAVAGDALGFRKRERKSRPDFPSFVTVVTKAPKSPGGH